MVAVGGKGKPIGLPGGGGGGGGLLSRTLHSVTMYF